MSRPGPAFLYRRFRASLFPRPGAAPRVPYEAAALTWNPAVTWIGHATVLLRLGGATVLTDPIFSERASPVGFAGPRRLVPPGVPLEALPPVDLALVSHDHYDHADLPTLRTLAARGTRFVVPRGMGELLADFADRRRENLAALAAMNLGQADLGRVGRHPEFGEVRLGQLLATWVVHDLNHLRQLAQMLARVYTEAIGPWSAYLPIVHD